MDKVDDFHIWRCMCGATTKVTKINCNKCGKQRWKQLGFDKTEADGIAFAICPLIAGNA